MSRLIEFLGICRKAGGLTYGAAQTKDMMGCGKVVCVLIMSDTSAKTANEISFHNKKNIPIIHLNNSKEELKQVLKTACGVIGITDENLSKKVISLASSQDKKEE